MFEERGEIETLLEPLLLRLEVTNAHRQSRYERLRLDPVIANDGDRYAVGVLENSSKEVRGFHRVPAGASRIEGRELEQDLGCGRGAQLAAWGDAHAAHLVLERMQDLVRIDPQISHELPEHVPFDLRVCKADMLAREQPVFPATRLVESAREHAIGRLSQPLAGNIDVCVFHGCLPLSCAVSMAR